MLATPPVHTLHSIIHDAFTCFLLCMHIHTVNNNKSMLYLHGIDLSWCQEPVKQLYSAPELYSAPVAKIYAK